MWWRRRPEGTISWSMVSLVVSCTAALALGLAVWVPRSLGAGPGVETVAPGLLTIARSARGQITLGDGVTASLFQSGLRLAHGDDILLETVTEGAMVSGVKGSVEPRRGGGHREEVLQEWSTVQVDRLSFGGGGATWSGTIRDDEGRVRAPLLIHVELRGDRVVTTVESTGVDGLVLHLDVRPATTGIPPALPDRNLRQRAWWATGEANPLYTNVLRTDVAVDAGGAARAVDLRGDGLLDVHVWADRLVLTVGSSPRPEIQAP